MKLSKAIENAENAAENARQTLGDTVSALRQKVRSGQALPELAGPVGTRAVQTARRNPGALALVGTGLALWAVNALRTRATPDASTVAVNRWEDEGGSPLPLDAADQTAWLHQAERIRDRAQAHLAAIESDLSRRLISARDAAAERAEVLKRQAEDTAAALGANLEHLGAAAREQVMAVREQALAAGEGVAEQARAGVAKADDTVRAHPVPLGVAALAAGVALAWALPRSRAESAVLNAPANTLLSQARAQLENAKTRAEAAAQAAASELEKGLDRGVRAARKVAEAPRPRATRAGAAQLAKAKRGKHVNGAAA